MIDRAKTVTVYVERNMTFQSLELDDYQASLLEESLDY